MRSKNYRYLCVNLGWKIIVIIHQKNKCTDTVSEVFVLRCSPPTVCVTSLFTLDAALGIVVLHVAPLHGHQLVHRQRVHDSRVPAPPRPLLHHTQTLHIPHAPEPQLAVSHPDSQHSGTGRLHHTSQPGERQREPLQEYTGKQKNLILIINYIFSALFISTGLKDC